MANHGRLKYLFGDEFDRELRGIMERLPALSDREIALEMRVLVERATMASQAKAMLQSRPGIVREYFYDGRYLIHDAVCRASHGDASWVAELLEYGADAGARSKSGDTAIHWVCKLYGGNPSAQLQALERLCRAGGNIDFLNDLKPVGEHQTPLIIAVQTYTWSEEKTVPDDNDKKTSQLVEACLRHGASVNATDTSGRTALHWVVMSGNTFIAKQLLDAGADPEIQDAKKRGMLDWWTHARNKACLELLKETMDPKHFAKKEAGKAKDEDSEVDSEDEVDQRMELKRYFPNASGAAAGAAHQPPRHVAGSGTVMSEDQDRLVTRLEWFGSELGWDRAKCLDALTRCK